MSYPYGPSQRRMMHVFDVLLPVTTFIEVAGDATAAMAATLFAALAPLFAVNVLVWIASVVVYAVHAPPRCRTCQSHFPADHGAENAEQRRTQLWRFHRWAEGSVAVNSVLGRPFGWVAERCGISATTSIWVTRIGGLLGIWAVWAGASTLLSWLLGTFMWTVTATIVIVLWRLLRLARVHHALRPWCPWCRRRDDDDQEREPDPDPAPGKTIPG